MKLMEAHHEFISYHVNIMAVYVGQLRLKNVKALSK